MKTVYVTVAEFLENGGELKLNRAIFEIHPQGYGYNLIGGFTGYFDDRIMVDNHDDSLDYLQFKPDNANIFVEVECTPIYK